MKRVYIILLLLFCLLSLSSCKNKGMDIYDNNNIDEFISLFYETINDEDVKYVACDFRTKTEYETEHLRQFQNYDLQNGSFEEFLNWLTSNYSKKHQVYLFMNEILNDDQLNELKKNYKCIKIYKGDYETLRVKGEEFFTFDSGPYDCGC